MKSRIEWKLSRTSHKQVPKRFRATVRRIERLAIKWEPMLALPGYAVQHKYLVTRHDEPATGATTHTRWQYRDAVICWYLPVVKGIPKQELEAMLVHEYGHVLLAPTPLDADGADADLHEAATENVAQALLRVHRWTKESR